MLSLYNNSNVNNMYVNQNYGQSVLNPYSFQQTTPVLGGYQQQSGVDFNSIFGLLSTALSDNIYNQPVENNAGFNINNWGNIGNINVGTPGFQKPWGSLLGSSQPQQTNLSSLFQQLMEQLTNLISSPEPTGKTPVTVDEQTITVKPATNSTTSAPTISSSGKTPVTVDQETVEIKPKSDNAEVHLFSGKDGRHIKAALNDPNHWRFSKEQQKVLENLDKAGKKALRTSNLKNKVLAVDENSKFVGLYDLKEAQKDLGGIKLSGDGGKPGQKYENNAKGKEFKGHKVASNTFVSPLAFDINGDGIKTSDKKVKYDIDGDGKLDKINDVADGTLSIRGGKSGLDVFGDNTDLDNDGKADGFKNGFDALKALAQKEGLINGKDDMKLDSKDLKILEDKYQLGMKTDGYNSKEKSLAELGITEINLGATDETKSKENFDGQGNLLMQQEGATFKLDGQEREYADVWHEKK